eukprot:GFYU01017761.1.p1 GENE.GFYU01017761.1~~GFYU01017761.1.p1  ORF type:complete len:790 (+),score=160.78 GFYU01017761.1:340-2370(+)
MLTKITAFPDDSAELSEMLEKTFPYVSFPELREIPLTVLSKLKSIPVVYLDKLSSSEDIYEALPMEVRRQIWETNEDRFRDEVYKLFTQYADEKKLQTAANELMEKIRTEPRLRRMNNPILQNLVKTIGNSERLYNTTLKFLRSLYVKTANPIFCTLRAEILMALHDHGISTVCETDPCHKFAWCLDACIRDDNIEERRIREMQSYFDKLGSPEVYGDLSMIINDHYACNTMVRNILCSLQGVVKVQGEPKKNDELKYITQLLTLGLCGHGMLESETWTLPKLDKSVVPQFYYVIAALLVDDMIREPNDAAEPLHGEFVALVNKTELAKKVTLYYVLTKVQQMDVHALEQLLPALLNVESIENEDAFFQSLTSVIIGLPKLSEDFRRVVFEEFLLIAMTVSEFIFQQVARLYLHCYSKIPRRELLASLKKCCVEGFKDTTGTVVECFTTLLAKLRRGQIKEEALHFLAAYVRDESVAKDAEDDDMKSPEPALPAGVRTGGGQESASASGTPPESPSVSIDDDGDSASTSGKRRGSGDDGPAPADSAGTVRIGSTRPREGNEGSEAAKGGGDGEGDGERPSKRMKTEPQKQQSPDVAPIDVSRSRSGGDSSPSKAGVDPGSQYATDNDHHIPPMQPPSSLSSNPYARDDDGPSTNPALALDYDDDDDEEAAAKAMME